MDMSLAGLGKFNMGMIESPQAIARPRAGDYMGFGTGQPPEFLHRPYERYAIAMIEPPPAIRESKPYLSLISWATIVGGVAFLIACAILGR